LALTGGTLSWTQPAATSLRGTVEDPQKGAASFASARITSVSIEGFFTSNGARIFAYTSGTVSSSQIVEIKTTILPSKKGSFTETSANNPENGTATTIGP